MHMPTVSKLETFGSMPCGGEHVLVRSFCCQLMYKTMGTLYLPSVPLARIHKDSGIINLRVEVNLTLSTRGLVEIHIQITGD